MDGQLKYYFNKETVSRILDELNHELIEKNPLENRKGSVVEFLQMRNHSIMVIGDFENAII